MKNNYSIEQFNADLESGAYTQLGMYPKYFITSDGGCLSFKSALENAELIRNEIKDGDFMGWRVVACDINWESFLYCDHSNKQIESAYDPVE
jgi:hypothetical protein